ncbi:PREDICTED: putative uncharacterized protein CXorf58 [Priapulus caudatus]|uniref:Uncharacterized protein n=1 Tax=Priapulus caudatus TaxID=37621 RepID=A0ABM1DXL2_PRICU|nr:PREDICTED: putative uncharacterized protein CXorf58 [Priapulus caudatus]XP_014664683.1 PREDICTED: putative uncharacterized protein CXorf58 [Priapulus caudatus]
MMFSDRESKAARAIQAAWKRHQNKLLFSMLKNVLCSMESCLPCDILAKLNPAESLLLKDKIFTTKVRFRFGGEEFPPQIYYKLFCDAAGTATQYITAKKVLRLDSKGALDACKMIGNREFYSQLLVDVCNNMERKITDEIDVVTIKDYMKYQSNLDEYPAYMGGRANNWRKLSLDDVPRWTMFHDVLEFVNSKRMSPELRASFQAMHAQPPSQSLQLQQLWLLARSTTSPDGVAHVRRLITPGLSGAYLPGRRSQQAMKRASKLRDVYTLNNKMACDELIAENSSERDADDNDNSDWEDKDAEDLYQWTKNLSINNLGSPHSMF